MKKNKIIGIISLIIPSIFAILYALNIIFWNQNNIFLYLLYGSLIISSILISIGVFTSKKNYFVAYINLLPAIFTIFFSIWQIILSNNHDLYHKYSDLLGGGVISFFLQILLVLSSGIYLIVTKGETLKNNININKIIRLFGLIGLIIYTIPFILLIPSYFLNGLLIWIIAWFILQGLLIGYLIFLILYNKLSNLYIAIRITLLLYIISLILMIVCELNNFINPLLSIIYCVFGLITIISIAIDLFLLLNTKE